MNKLKLEDDHKCFVCGLENEQGLRLHWTIDGNVMTAYFVSEAKYQGWKGILHGGILATLLDEAMTRLVGIVCGEAVTAEMTVRYVLPAIIGKTLYIRGEIVKESRRLVEMKASIHKESQDGAIVAHAVGKAVRVL